MYKEEVECCVCEQVSSHMIIGSTNSFGYPDLDTRPPEMQRSTIYHLVQRCPSCGYCAPDLSECKTDVSEIVATDKYQYIIADTQMPKVAASFLALSYIKQKQGQFADSAWRSIHASWICDDKNNYEESVKCRKQAISLISMANSHAQTIANQTGLSEIITIDLMRRAGMFEEALKLAEFTKTKEIEEIIIKVIKYEEKLIAQKNIESHTISESLGEE
jgi:hypothetical protein